MEGSPFFVLAQPCQPSASEGVPGLTAAWCLETKSRQAGGFAVFDGAASTAVSAFSSRQQAVFTLFDLPWYF